ncbi:MAG: TerB N-terminal domain-containing protein [Verrucomicrobiales bacterium]
MSLTWHPPLQSVQFGDIKLLRGMFYSDSGPTTWQVEPSAILTSAPIGRHADSPGNDLGYYPSYGNLSPSQKRAYLEWLAMGRRDPHPEQRALGYLFLFFYGIEHRIIIEQDRDPALIDELISILQHYSPHHRSRSLRSYYLSLAHFGSRLMGPEHYRYYWPQCFEMDEGKTGEEPMKLVLANLCELGEPMHWSIGYRLAMANPASRKSVVVTKAQLGDTESVPGTLRRKRVSGRNNQSSRNECCAVFVTNAWLPAAIADRFCGKSWPCQLKVHNVAAMHSHSPGIEIWNTCVEDLSGYTRAVFIKSNRPGRTQGLDGSSCRTQRKQAQPDADILGLDASKCTPRGRISLCRCWLYCRLVWYP